MVFGRQMFPVRRFFASLSVWVFFGGKPALDGANSVGIRADHRETPLSSLWSILEASVVFSVVGFVAYHLAMLTG